MKKDTYCYELRDGNEVVKYGKTAHLRTRELSYERRRKRGWIEYTDFIPDKEPMTEEGARGEEINRIKAHEERYGKKPRYNRSY